MGKITVMKIGGKRLTFDATGFWSVNYGGPWWLFMLHGAAMGIILLSPIIAFAIIPMCVWPDIFGRFHASAPAAGWCY